MKEELPKMVALSQRVTENSSPVEESLVLGAWRWFFSNNCLKVKMYAFLVALSKRVTKYGNSLRATENGNVPDCA